MPILKIKNLHKEYGRITAVNQLNLEIEAGSVFGLLGPNGSGKTTTLGMILGVINPSSGEYSWFDDGAKNEHRKRIGSILEKPNFYPTFSAYKNLQVACLIKEVPESRIDEVLNIVGLFERKDDPFKTYSLGMKQRLAIASALLSNPEILILDEPTNGLDPKGISEIRQLIIDISLSGKTIILASHLLDEVQKVCSEFAILNFGEKIHQGNVDDDFGEDITFEISSKDNKHLEETLQSFNSYLSHKWLKDRIELKCQADTSPEKLSRFLAQKEIYPTHFNVVKKNLEQQFMEILSKHA